MVGNPSLGRDLYCSRPGQCRRRRQRCCHPVIKIVNLNLTRIFEFFLVTKKIECFYFDLQNKRAGQAAPG